MDQSINVSLNHYWIRQLHHFQFNSKVTYDWDTLYFERTMHRHAYIYVHHHFNIWFALLLLLYYQWWKHRLPLHVCLSLVLLSSSSIVEHERSSLSLRTYSIGFEYQKSAYTLHFNVLHLLLPTFGHNTLIVLWLIDHYHQLLYFKNQFYHMFFGKILNPNTTKIVLFKCWPISNTK